VQGLIRPTPYTYILLNTKKIRRAIQKKGRGMLTSSAPVVLLHDNARPHTAARTRALLDHFDSDRLTTLLIALISLRATTACLPTRKTGCDHRTLTIMRSRWNVLKHGRAYRRQTSLTQAYKNLFPDTSASIPAVNALRCSSSMYVFFVYNFFLIVCFLNSSRKLLSEYPSYKSSRSSGKN
jgi:hypothetical protein